MKLRKVISAVLALCLVLSLCVSVYAVDPDGTADSEATETDPAESPSQEEPEVSQEPQVSQQPEVSQRPAFPLPEESQKPDASPEPEVPLPEVSQTPVTTVEPQESKDPNIAQEPDDFEGPSFDVPSEDDENSDGMTPDTIEDDRIDVSVPASDTIVINPYRLEVRIDSYQGTAQIVHKPMEFINRSEFAVSVDISVVGVVPEGSRAEFVTRKPLDGEREVFLFVEFRDSDEEWSDTFDYKQNQIMVSQTSVSAVELLTLEPGTSGYYRIYGAMSSHVAWEETDTFGVTLAYTFNLAPESDESDDPADDGSASDDSTNDSPANDSPANDGPTSDGPSSDGPTSDGPTSDRPANDEPTGAD